MRWSGGREFVGERGCRVGWGVKSMRKKIICILGIGEKYGLIRDFFT